MKKILFLSTLLSAFCFASCEQVDEPKDMTIELARPENISVKTELATATVTWRAAEKAAGYAYVLDKTVNEENPDLSVFTEIPAEPAELYIEGLSKGEHTITMLSLGDNDHTTNSLMRSATFTIDPTLPAPSPAFTEEEGGVVTITWTAIKHVAGYAYRFNAGEWKNLAADVTSITETLKTNATHVFEIKALGDNKIAVDSEAASLEIKLIDTSKGAWLLFSNGEKIMLEPKTANVYEYTIKGQKNTTFELSVDGKSYGYAIRSGNGGVGDYVAVFASKKFDKYVRESAGRMMEISAPAEGDEATNAMFWINQETEYDVNVKFDLSNDVPSYYMTFVGYEDASVILSEYFDLMATGSNFADGAGHWLIGNATQKPENIKGVEITETAGTGQTKYGVEIKNSADAPEYMKIRGLEGWTLVNCHEMYGEIKASTGSNVFGVVTTPALGYAGTVTVTYKAVPFGGTTENVSFKVLGDGTISAASVKHAIVAKDSGNKAADVTGEKTEDIAPSGDGKSIVMTKVHCPRFDNSFDKPMSEFTITITGVTADTKLSLDTNGSTNGRIIFDDIVVKKN